MPPQDLLFYSGINHATEHAGMVYQTANPDLELPGDRYEKLRAYLLQQKEMEVAMYACQQDPDNVAAKVQLSREMQKKLAKLRRSQRIRKRPGEPAKLRRSQRVRESSRKVQKQHEFEKVAPGKKVKYLRKGKGFSGLR
ncbi:unnamed protein product [Sphagnum balticum]